ncbi:hypothetical protein [Vibrio cyclitrophicus]|uniref:hypothetical protein n=1 Tax=Vibrio cyclitrophicus TaxID=47951 RepID=UPI0038B3B8E4
MATLFRLLMIITAALAITILVIFVMSTLVGLGVPEHANNTFGYLILIQLMYFSA